MFQIEIIKLQKNIANTVGGQALKFDYLMDHIKVS